MFVQDDLMKKWSPILEAEEAAPIASKERASITARLLENQEAAMKEARGGDLQEDAAANVAGNMANYDPVMISLVRRAMPNLIAYDVCGVQAMTGPTGLIFAMRPRFVKSDNTLGDEAFYNEAPSGVSGNGATPAGTSPAALNADGAVGDEYDFAGQGIATADAEKLGTPQGGDFAQMGFDIEKVTVTAKSRALKAQYTVELAQDLKQIHGLDAEAELSQILAAEVLAEINREVIRTIYTVAKTGAQNTDLTTAGQFDLDLDSNGRWSVEKFKGLMFQIEREANEIAKETRRGKGNIIICSADVASALSMAGMLDTGLALKAAEQLEVDNAGNTFAGTLNGRYKVYIDPYHIGENFLVVGYKGSNAYDAGLFYAPYVPLQMFKTLGEDDFQPRIGFKTRYGMVANPFAEGTDLGNGRLVANTNIYYRRVLIKNLTGAAS